MTFEKEFKDAISNLPSIEKDKLILRLLKKDLVLANRLYFELVSDLSVEETRANKADRIADEVDRFSKNFYSPGYLHVDLRYLSGEINEHVSTTKDKLGEIELQLLMIEKTLSNLNERLAIHLPGSTRKLYVYLLSKCFKIMILMQKQHEDVLYDFKDSIQNIGQLIAQNDGLMKVAIFNGFDVNWFISFSIPNDIHLIYKNLRARGNL